MSIFSARRSIKPVAMDASREVPREVLLQLLEDAHWAPTHGLTQPWRFHVFEGAARARLADGLQGLYDRVTPTAARNEDKRAKLGTTPRLGPVVIAVAAHVEPNGKIPEIEEIAAVSCAVQNLMLSAHEKGLGSFWSTPPVTMSAEFATWLGLDATHRMLGLVYLGYPKAGNVPATSTRDALEKQVVFHDA
ncbi:nitroreductase family protein [Rariglobus hedericola]|uniref:Putative NAD(P)H nitroreductase n=1 Tax=Rariglobus hedericola TaxID=2597822 RepID=A0A556QLI7_9BACT|nr:nitroreductase [Rariglobus hedericola]TSJ77495.1 nitroreductase [Rariglobus hedericola]